MNLFKTDHIFFSPVILAKISKFYLSQETTSFIVCVRSCWIFDHLWNFSLRHFWFIRHFRWRKLAQNSEKSTWTLLFQQICFTGFSSFTADSDRLSPRFSLEGLKHQPMRGPYLNLDQSATSMQKALPDFRVIAETAKYWKHWPKLPRKMPNTSSWFPEKISYLLKHKIFNMNKPMDINQSYKFYSFINILR